jgi:hypothetical protein
VALTASFCGALRFVMRASTAGLPTGIPRPAFAPFFGIAGSAGHGEIADPDRSAPRDHVLNLQGNVANAAMAQARSNFSAR